jgi:hypothetical protein
MAYLGNAPTSVPLTSADITDGIITSAKIADGTIVNADINASAGIVSTKLSGVGASAGEVIQVVSATQTGSIVTSDTSFVNGSNATANVSITPSSASNKVFVVVATGGYGNPANYTIFRDSTNLGDATNGMVQLNSAVNGTVAMAYLDTPNTTSSVKYQIYQKTGSGQVAITGRDGVQGSITAFEIKG